jgi:hypothetical protein
MKMTIRALAAALTLTLAPFAAYADAPSGDFNETHRATLSKSAPVADTRAENRNYVEFTIDELVESSRAAGVTVEQVRGELAAMPQPVVGA